MATTRLMTADDLLTLPDDGSRYELIEGALHHMSPGGFAASRIAMRIGGRLDAFADERKLGRVSGADGGYVFHRDPDTVLAPDVAFVRADRLPPEHQQLGFLEVAPDLVVEVVSPGDRPGEIAAKVAFYLGAGVPLVWAIYPRLRQVHVHTAGAAPRVLREGDLLDGGEVLPGFQLPVTEIFR
jgi:Uma2 family endonuclease